MMIGRRGLLRGLVSLIAAPAIVRAASLMPISVPELVSVSCAVPGDGGLAVESMPGPLGPTLVTMRGIDAFGHCVTETRPLSATGRTQTAFRSISSVRFTFGKPSGGDWPGKRNVTRT